VKGTGAGREMRQHRQEKHFLRWLGDEDGNGSGSSALQLLGSLLPQTPSSMWGYSPLATSGRGGWQRESLGGFPVAWESAGADSFLDVGVLTPSPQNWTLRSTSSTGSVLGVEDDLRTPLPGPIDGILQF